MPAVIEPNSAFTGGTPKIIIACSGGEYWGGCTVNISFDGVAYSQIGEITAPAKQGVLTAALAAYAGANPDTTDTLGVNCAESLTLPAQVTQADATALRTLSLIAAPPTDVSGVYVLPTNGELLAFGEVTVTGTYAANLTYLVRGAYGTSPSAHNIGDQFTVLDVTGTDGTSVAYDLPAQYIGQPIYLKFCSFNVFNQALQDISTVLEYQYTPTGAGYGTAAAGAPQTPTGFSDTSGSFQVALAWNANPPTDNVTSYTLYRAAGLSAAFSTALEIWSGDALGTADSSVNSNASYTYFLEANNGAGSSGPTAGLNVTTPAASLASLSTGLSTTNSAVTSLSTSAATGLSTAQSGISSLSTGLSSTNSGVSSLSTSASTGVSTTSSSVTSLSTSASTGLSTAQSSVASVSTALSSTNSGVSSLSTSTSSGISTTQSGVASVSSALSSTASSVSSLSTSASTGVSTAVSRDTSLSTGLSSTNSNVSSLSTSASSGISTNASSVSSLSTSSSSGLSTTNSNVGSLSTSTSSGISTAQSGVGSLSTGLSTTSSAVASLLTSASSGLSTTNSSVGSLSTSASSGISTNASALASLSTALSTTNSPYQTSSIPQSSAISLTANTPTNITSITLSPGDWDVHANVAFNPASTTTFNNVSAGISLSSGSIPAMGTEGTWQFLDTGSTVETGGYGPWGVPLGTVRVNVSSPTTVYLVISASFISGALTAWGTLSARRAR